MPKSHPNFCKALVLLLLTFSAGAEAGEYQISDKKLDEIGRVHGQKAKQRVSRWRNLAHDPRNASLSDRQKLELANDFINQTRFLNDIDHWRKKDYWASPLETLNTNGGDCEDFGIAKYFTLLEMGVSLEKLRLTYVKALELNQAHMVLTYYENANAEPLILDNLISQIKPASQRRDLLPVYSFNAEGLWITNANGTGKRVGGAERLSLWNDLLAKMKKETGK